MGSQEGFWLVGEVRCARCTSSCRTARFARQSCDISAIAFRYITPPEMGGALFRKLVIGGRQEYEREHICVYCTRHTIHRARYWPPSLIARGSARAAATHSAFT